ncbi:chemotaxis protein CheW [Sporolactobacillus terrae]|uniref:Chemotaxis protein CheW n=1 Tax=Sporolactobacillus terrae TaxID=269673 RepID=A0A410D8F7_9BACL|nr:chemotaxis protein CheW [Sporolactobacillus terrae]QAA22362.1 chemotaxis protein CheW [Sporolactobacillus terrae]QAA25338.1 chemotaxis protein CheW [Sporolactobacillus terrae]UAK17148.1 chemotaxis protein CheW [Sporolactobacillus terrae]BBN98678.1 chemotaxis protein CheW [Sporolactobacillus terrae]
MTSQEKQLKVILFEMNGETYGVPVEQVLSIEKVDGITRLPNAASFVKGVMNLRSIITPIIDVRERFQMGHSKITPESRIIVVEQDEMSVGLLVDSSKEVLDIDADQLEQTPEMIGGSSAEYLSAVAKIGEDQLLLLLNLKQVLNQNDVAALRAIGDEA